MNNLQEYINFDYGFRKLLVYSCDRNLSNIIARKEIRTEDLSNHNITILYLIRDDMIKEVNGVKIVQVWKKTIVNYNHDKLVHYYNGNLQSIFQEDIEYNIKWLVLDDLLNDKITHLNVRRYPSKVVVRKSGNTLECKKMFLNGNTFDNDGDYDKVVIGINKMLSSKQIVKSINCEHSYIRPVEVRQIHAYGVKRFSNLWKMHGKCHRFNGKAIEVIKGIEPSFHMFLDKLIPARILSFDNGIPSQELNKASVLETMLFDRDYGKVVEAVYSTQKIPTEKEVFDILGYSNE